MRLLVTTGFLGGFTTFSAFSLDTLVLWERGQPALAAAYVSATLALSLGGVVAGLMLARTVT
jgi:CrcB protein